MSQSTSQGNSSAIQLQSNTAIFHHWSCDIKQHYSYSRALLVITLSIHLWHPKCVSFVCFKTFSSNDMNRAIKYFLPGFSQTSGWLYITNSPLSEWEQGALLGTTMLWCWWSHRLWSVHWCLKDLEFKLSSTKREVCMPNDSWVIHN